VLEPFDGVGPAVDPSAWCHWSAVLIGDVVIGPRANVWPGVVLRGDQGSLRVGAETSLQDGTIAHATESTNIEGGIAAPPIVATQSPKAFG
jgi:carbonic anhydrase/acetyltransferase-like protein (isoleucine patch superfamily)